MATSMESTSGSENDDTENILYDLLVLAEWAKEPETLTKVIAEKPKGSLVGKLSSVAYRSAWTFLRSTGLPLRSSTPCSLPAPLIKLINAQINWQMATTSDDKLLAVLEECCVEIRSCRDDFATSLGKCPIPKDPYPQWRQVAWSQDCTMLACSDSSGNVRVLDVMASILFTIEKTCSQQQLPGVPLDLSCAVASLIFAEEKNTSKWSGELIVITYQGSLHSYLVSPNDGYILNHRFQFSSEHPLGISSAVYLPGRSLLLIGSCSQEEGQDAVTMATRHGITAWRRLDEEPYYKLVTDYSEEIQKVGSSRRLFRRMISLSLLRRSDKQDGIYKMCVSPKGNQLVTVHQSGLVALWDIPSLKNRGSWSLENQPGYDEKNPNILIPKKKKLIEGQPSPNSLIDINFWSEKALILARYSGAVSVASTKQLRNLLGDSSEWFEPAPRINRASDKGFLSIECESKTSALKRRRTESEREQDDSRNQLLDNEDDDSDDDDDATILIKGTKLMKQAMYFVTESERFQPPRKRPKVVSRTYRLVSLQKTTPEELYARRIENEEYGEALVLARQFGLDADLVYQRQWRKARVSIASIQDYLSKITKRAWVLHECLERVPDDIDAARELLQYGLRGTDLEALVAIGRGEDHGRFILSSDFETDDGMDHHDDSQETSEHLAVDECKQQLMEQVNFKSLTLEQRELCRCRLKLLTYLDRLRTYEVILGGGEAAARFYSDSFFKTFRSQNIVEATVQFARDSDWQAVETLFTYHGKDVLPHWLMILNNFPETTSPAEYSSLLPEASMQGNQDSEIMQWEVAEGRQEDWCESERCQAAINPTPVDYGAFLYDHQPYMTRFKVAKLTKALLLRDWYTWRAAAIERLSGQVDNALELINLGMERNIKGLDELHDDLLTLDIITYECQTDVGIHLDSFQVMSDLQRMQLMMDKCPKDMYIKNIKRWIIPLLERCEKRRPGQQRELLTQYLLSMAKDNLTNCVMIFESSKPTVSGRILQGDEFLMTLALQCVYITERDDQLSQALAILDCMPRRSFGMLSESTSSLHDKLAQLSDHLRATEILSIHKVPKPPHFLRDSQADSEQAKGLMVRISRQAARRKPALTPSEWKQLLRDMLELQRKVYSCLEPEVCYEVYTESLLGSNCLANIQLAGEMLTTSPSQDTLSSSRYVGYAAFPSVRISYDTSVELVLSAAREYFNSSADLMDSCMDLARCCLQLIHDCPPGIQEELDLIASLALLDDYNVSILPLQVRLCSNRLELIESVLSSVPSAYKDSKQLLRLAKLLRVAGTSEANRKGQVLLLLAQATLAAADYLAMHDTCTQLMQAGYSDAWEVCYQLAIAEPFKDLTAKRELLAFSLAHCDERSLEVVLKARNALESEMLYLSVNAHSLSSIPTYADTEDEVAMETDQPSEHEDQTVLRSALGKTTAKTRQVLAATGTTTKAVLVATGTTTKAVLAAVGDQKWWKDTLKWVRPLAGDSVVEEYRASSQGNAQMEWHGCHPFYSMVVTNHNVSRGQMNYGMYRVAQTDGTPVKLTQTLLRAGLLEGTSDPDLAAQSGVLLQAALEVMTSDTTLGLCYLLALPNPLDAEQCFDKLPRSAMTLQLAAYYYALQIHSLIQPSQVMTLDPAYQLTPSKLIGQIVSQVGRDSGREWSEEQKALVSQLHRYVELLADFTQAEALQALGRGVDVGRFTQDNDYKHETILGLAMTTENEVYQLALSLAQRYQLPLWEVYMTHLEYLFTDSGLTTAKLEEFVSNLGILPTLTSRPADFCDRLKLYVFPTIEGKDHTRLIYYYSLLQRCVSGIKHGVTPDLHIKSLKKLKAAAQGLDYKGLLDGKQDPVDVIGPVLNGSNVHVIAKLASKIPLQTGVNISSSQVFLAYIIKFFWDGDQGNKKPPESVAEWLHRYEACGEFFSRLQPEDFTKFIASIVFTEKSIDKLGLECRQNIVKRALKLSRQQTGKQKLAATTASFTVESAIEKLQRFAGHLQSLDTKRLQPLVEYDQETSSNFSIKYDLTQGDPEKFKAFLVDLLSDGATLELTSDLLRLTSPGCETPLSAVQHTLHTLLRLLKGEPSQATEGLVLDGEPLELMEVVLGTVSKHDQQGGTMVRTGHVLDVLRPFCSDSNVDAKLRIDLLRILEKTFELGEDDSLLLLFYRTEALVSPLWKQQVLKTDLASDDARFQLFKSLLGSSQSMDQLRALSQLLQQWPPVPTSKLSNDPSHHPWVKLLVAWIQYPEHSEHTDALLDIFEYLQELQLINTECVEVLYHELVSQGCMLTAMKLVLINKDTRLYPIIIEYMQQEKTISPSCYDNQLFHLLLGNGLTAKIATTPYYPPLVEYLLSSPQAEDFRSKVNVIADQLRSAGHEAIAGTLLLRCRGTHSMMGTLGTAYSVLKHWMAK